jgi:hypothetical protein
MTSIAQHKPDLSGEWMLNPQASTLSPVVAPTVQSGALRIEHHSPREAVTPLATQSVGSFNVFRNAGQRGSRCKLRSSGSPFNVGRPPSRCL